MTTLYRAILVAGFMATASLADVESPAHAARHPHYGGGTRQREPVSTTCPLVRPTSRARGLYLDGYGVYSLLSKDHGPGRSTPA